MDAWFVGRLLPTGLVLLSENGVSVSVGCHVAFLMLQGVTPLLLLYEFGPGIGLIRLHFVASFVGSKVV